MFLCMSPIAAYTTKLCMSTPKQTAFVNPANASNFVAVSSPVPASSNKVLDGQTLRYLQGQTLRHLDCHTFCWLNAWRLGLQDEWTSNLLDRWTILIKFEWHWNWIWEFQPNGAHYQRHIFSKPLATTENQQIAMGAARLTKFHIPRAIGCSPAFREAGKFCNVSNNVTFWEKLPTNHTFSQCFLSIVAGTMVQHPMRQASVTQVEAYNVQKCWVREIILAKQYIFNFTPAPHRN